jgi:2-haloalkanoic acid dehalogenase type II
VSAVLLTDYKVLTFDCYGTLIDWETGIWDAYQPLLMANNCSEITREQALEEHAKLESKQQLETPDILYSELLSRVHSNFSRQFDLKSSREIDTEFGNSIQLWPAFADSADALRFLKTKFKLVILSNVSREGFAASNKKLGVEFDAIYTAEDIGSYKPSSSNFEYMLERLEEDLGLKKRDVLHTAQSLYHDHIPAKLFDLANVWIDRRHLSESGNWGATAKVPEPPQIDFKYFSMAEMARAVKAE